jgi:hypothetical protein
MDWVAGQVFTRWRPLIPETGWLVGYESINISHLSTEYVLVPVTVTKAGVPYNPVTDVVQFAFMPTPTQIPGNTDWVSGVWETDTSNILYPYNAKCLIGPAGAVTLGTGNYIIYLKVTDSPEVPVLVGGQLVVS